MHRPRFGLLRGREFWMKDMYSFDERYVTHVISSSPSSPIQIASLIMDSFVHV